MYNSHHDPTVGVLDAVLCWVFYMIGSTLHEVNLHTEVTFYLQNISFVIGIIVGLVALMRNLGFDMNLKKKIKKKK